MLYKMNVLLISTDLSRNGNLKIKGTITEEDLQIPCRVRLFEKESGKMIADIKTNDAGSYQFMNLANTKYFVVAHHPKSQFNAVIQDNVVPK